MEHVVDTFARDGAVVTRGLLDPAALDLVAAAVTAALADPGELVVEASAPDDPGRFVEVFRSSDHHPHVHALLAAAPQVGATAAALTGSDVVRFHHDHVLVKTGGTRQRTPWHQDQPYYDLDGRQLVSAWIPIDPVDRDTCLELVAGSHAGPWLLPRTFLDREARWFPEGSLAELPDIDADRGAHRILAWDLEPGDVLWFHGLTVHGAPGVAGPTNRRVLSLRFVGDDVRWAPRPWRTSPPFPELVGALEPGAPLDHPLFPVVHTAR